MKFIRDELAKLGRELWSDPKPERKAELYAAQQALTWAIDPEVTMSPFDLLVRSRRDSIEEAGTDYSDQTRRATLSGNE